MATTANEVAQAAISMATGIVKGNTADTLGAPVDMMNMAIKPVTEKFGIATDTPFGGSAHFRTLFGMDTKDKNVAETAGSMISVGGAAKAMIVGAARLSDVSKAVDVEKFMDITRNHPEVNAASKYNMTGVYGNEGERLKAVISDKDAKILEPNYQNNFGVPASAVKGSAEMYRLDEVFQHDQLFKLYPELKDIDVVFKELPKGSLGSFAKDSKTMTVNSNVGPEKQREIILHELQHGVQAIEGFQGGANTSQFLPKDVNKTAKAVQSAVIRGRESADPAIRDAAERFKDRFNNKIKDAHTRYENVPGEQEARFTQDTRDLDLPSLASGIRNMLKNNQTPQNWDTQPLPSAVAKGTITPAATASQSTSILDTIRAIVTQPK